MQETEKSILFEKLETIPQYINFLRNSKNGLVMRPKANIIETYLREFIYVSYGNMVRDGDQVKFDSSKKFVDSGLPKGERRNLAFFKCFIVKKAEPEKQSDFFNIIVQELIPTKGEPDKLVLGNYCYDRKYKRLYNGYFEHIATSNRVFTYNDNPLLKDKAAHVLLGLQNRYFFTNKPKENVFNRYDKPIEDLKTKKIQIKDKIEELKESQYLYYSENREVFINSLTERIEKLEGQLDILKTKKEKNLILNADYNFFIKKSLSQLVYFDEYDRKDTGKYLLKIEDRDSLKYLQVAKNYSQNIEVKKQKAEEFKLKTFIETAKIFRSFYSLDEYHNTYIDINTFLNFNDKSLASLFHSKLHSYLGQRWVNDNRAFVKYSLQKKEENEKKENTEDYRYNHAQYYNTLSNMIKIKSLSAEEKAEQIAKDIKNI